MSQRFCTFNTCQRLIKTPARCWYCRAHTSRAETRRADSQPPRLHLNADSRRAAGPAHPWHLELPRCWHPGLADPMEAGLYLSQAVLERLVSLGYVLLQVYTTNAINTRITKQDQVHSDLFISFMFSCPTGYILLGGADVVALAHFHFQ